MAKIEDRDRLLLGDAGLALDDENYVQAVAGWGAGDARVDEGVRVIPWSLRASDRRLRFSPAAVRRYAARWRELRKKNPLPRLLIEALAPMRSLPDPLAVYRVLSRNEAGTGSTVLDLQLSRAEPRMELPMRVGAWRDDFAALNLQKISSIWPASSIMSFHELSREHARFDVLLLRGSVRAATLRLLESSFSVRTSLVLLVGPVDATWPRMAALIGTLLSETQAAGISFLQFQSQSEFESRFTQWAFEISHNTPLDLGLRNAFGDRATLNLMDERLISAFRLPTAARSVGRRLMALPPTANVRLPAATPSRINLGWTKSAPAAALGREIAARAENLPFDEERKGGTALSEIATAERAARAKFAADEPERLLQADLFRIAEGKTARHEGPFLLGEPYRIDVFIDAPGRGQLQADQVFPDGALDWQRADKYTLGVIFSEANQWDAPQTGELILERYGASTNCSFGFTPAKAGAFRARVTIHYRGRVLQTALLEAMVMRSAAGIAEDTRKSAPRLVIEARVRRSFSMLDSRRAFDASLVLNRTVDDTPTLQGAGQGGAFISSLEEIKEQMETISSLLQQVANEAKKYGKGLASKPAAEMLVHLATEGRELYNKIVVDYVERSSAAEALKRSEYLQIVATKPDAVVPLELVYEYTVPKADALVCANAVRALREGRCPAECVPTASPAPHVCPMGFWGLSRVIERHVHDPELQSEAKVLCAEPMEGRSTLPLKGTALLAASNNVPDHRKLMSCIAGKWSGGVEAARKWKEWEDAVRDKKPVLIVALPHSTGTGTDIALEIGGDTLASKFIDGNYVRVPASPAPPLLLLVGCDTAGAADARAYTRHVAQFRRQGAPVILGTLATVFGEDAAEAVELIVGQVAATVKNEPVRFGEALRAAKREALAGGLLIVLALIGFGDADWQLEFKP